MLGEYHVKKQDSMVQVHDFDKSLKLDPTHCKAKPDDAYSSQLFAPYGIDKIVAIVNCALFKPPVAIY